MTTLTDRDLVTGVQEYWLVRIDGGSPYANLLDAFAPAARAKFEPDMHLLGGPHQGARIKPAQYWRAAEQLAENGKGIEQERAAEALRIRGAQRRQ